MSYRRQLAHVEYEDVVRGPPDHQPAANEPADLLALLSGPYLGQTSGVYRRDPRGWCFYGADADRSSARLACGVKCAGYRRVVGTHCRSPVGARVIE